MKLFLKLDGEIKNFKMEGNSALCESTEDECHRLLRQAVRHSDIDSLSELLEGGLDPNIISDQATLTVLQEAVCLQNLDVITLLLHYNADPNRNGTRTHPCLIGAACRGNLDAFKLLVEHSADLNVKFGGYREQSVLQASAYHGHIGIVRYAL